MALENLRNESLFESILSALCVWGGEELLYVTREMLSFVVSV